MKRRWCLNVAFLTAWAILVSGSFAVFGGEETTDTPVAEPVAKLTAKPVTMESLLLGTYVMTGQDRDYTCRQASSYDRAAVSPTENWFANADASQFVREEVNENAGGRKEKVLMDVQGPGAIVRWWITGGDYNVYIYIDGATEPTIQCKVFDLIGGPFLCGAPLSEETARGRNLYLPIPYAKSIKITRDLEGDQGANYYQINYRTYPEGTPVESFSMEQLERCKQLKLLQIAQDLLRLPEECAGLCVNAEGKVVNRSSEFDVQDFQFELPEGAKAVGEKASTFLTPCDACVRKLQLKISARDLTQALRSTVLVMAFDDLPCVRCPIGDFFGSGVGVNPYQTHYTKVDKDGTMTCYWQMPFGKSVRVGFENLSDQPVKIEGEVWILDDEDKSEDVEDEETNKVVDANATEATPSVQQTAQSVQQAAQSVQQATPQAASERCYFHCTWHQQRNIQTKQGEGTMDWNYITLEGKGLYVGDVLAIKNRSRAWWGEGDEKIFVDGEAFPSHFGTGSEDYYGYAWGTAQFFDSPWRAQPRAEGPESYGNITNLRFRSLDAIPFTKSLKFDMEVWHWAATQVDYAVATFWYGTKDTKAVGEAFSEENLNTEAAAPVRYEMLEPANKDVLLDLPPGENNPRNSEGDFLKLNDGRILFVYTHYYGNSTDDDATAYLAAIVSADNGLTWSAPEKIVENNGKRNVMSVSLLRLADGRIGLFYLRKDGLQQCMPVVRYSEDDGKTWSEPNEIAEEASYNILNNSRVIQLASGVILVPIARHANTASHFEGNADCFCFRSEDGGKTWTRSTSVENLGAMFQEPGLVPLADGRILMYIRTDAGCQILSFSSDEGKTWSRGERSQFVSSLAPMSIRTIPGTDHFLAVWNETLKMRETFTVAELDANLNFVKKFTLDDLQMNDVPRWFCYPAILPLGNGEFLIAYCAGDPSCWGLNTTRIVRLKGM